MKNILSNIKLIFEIFILSHKFDPKITLYEFLHGICLNLRKVLNVLMPACIINSIVDGKKWNVVIVLAVIYGGLQCIFSCGEKCFKHLQEAHGFRACNLLRLSMNKKFMRMDYADTENSQIMDSFEEAKDSMWEFADVGYVLFDDIIGNLITFICMSYILMDVNPFVYAIVLGMVSLNVGIYHKKNKYVHDSDLKEKILKKWMNYMTGLMQNYEVGKEIRIYNANRYMLQKYNFYADNYRNQIKEREKNIARFSVVQGILSFVQLLVVYLSAIRKYILGNLKIGSFLLYVSSINELTESVRNLLAACIELTKVSFYYKDYVEYMDIPEKMWNSGEEKPEKAGTGIIELKNVSFYYPGCKEAAVKNVSMSIRHGERVGIVGENGSGKSTLIKLLLRLYDPSEGAIYFNGKDIRLYEYRSYLNLFKAVFQDFAIFSYSILENIVFDNNIDLERLNTIMDMTGFGNQISKYAKGLDSMVTKVLSDDGIILSGGEQQLLAITRTFYHEAEVVIFDEPTAALDPIKEADVYKMIEKVSNEKTRIFCAHRMSSTKFCDKIVVLDRGGIIETGIHDELMELKGTYYDLFTKQASLYKTNNV